MMTNKRWWLSGTAVALAGACLAVPNRADACGGFFCDGGPQPMPVDQSGEDILFIADGSTVEVHIRIQYKGDPVKFAWVIPLLSEPTGYGVGSDALFNNIKNASVPSYGITNVADDCFDPGGNRDEADSPSAADDGGGEGEAPNDGPTVLARKTVGAFDITILSDGTAATLIAWLNDNGYLQDPEAEPIFEEYLQENHLFAAIKLSGGAGLDELHPITLDFNHPEPCVPLRLTRIAAVDDMDVRTYFLGESRVVPLNYRHVLVNPLKIDWPNQGVNYKEVIVQAVDADHAEGRAFVTEYAGTSSIVARDDLDFFTGWSASAFEGLTAASAIVMLQDQNMWFCDEYAESEELCSSLHPLVEGLIDEFLPVPDGVNEFAFYTDPFQFEDLIDEAVWNPETFSMRLSERVIEPARHSAQLLGENPYLTRMYTAISPHEMITDPMFHSNPDLEEVAATRIATNRILCSGDSVWTLPDGREVFVPAGQPWPQISEFYEERVQDTPNFGAPVDLADHTADIDAELAAYHTREGWVPPEPGSDEDGDGSATDADPGAADDGGSSQSCACRTDGRRGSNGALGLLGFTLLFGLRRRSGRTPAA